MVNYILSLFGVKPIYFLGDNKYFRATLVLTGIWKGIGWSSIVYLAAISNIDTTMYEAAICDGATRFQRMWYITLPSIMSTVTVILILNIGGLLDAGFDQIFNLYNAAVYETGDIIDTYVYRTGLREMKYSLATAVGLFKNGIGFILVTGTNFVARKISDYGIW
jgi:putative aldouronate transport system permease protein